MGCGFVEGKDTSKIPFFRCSDSNVAEIVPPLTFPVCYFPAVLLSIPCCGWLGPIDAAGEEWRHEGVEKGGQMGGGFPPGEHPLEGVPNFEDLAPPETLSAKVDLSEVSHFSGLDKPLWDFTGKTCRL